MDDFIIENYGRIQKNYYFFFFFTYLSTKQNAPGRTHYELPKGIHLVKLFKLQNAK